MTAHRGRGSLTIEPVNSAEQEVAATGDARPFACMTADTASSRRPPAKPGYGRATHYFLG